MKETLNQLVAQCQQQLTKSTDAQAYIESRGIPKEVFAKFSLGLFNHNTYSVFNGRIVLPVRDITGEFVTIQARQYENQQGPKYIHGSYDKSQHLYGLFEARDFGLDKPWMVFEGQIDAIIAQSIGIPAVAQLGTALAFRQLCLLRMFTDKLLLWHDADKGGLRSTESVQRLVKETDMQAHIAERREEDLSAYVMRGGDPRQHPNVLQYWRLCEINQIK